jgi:hypothetical protein
MAVIIPCYNEPDLVTTLDSLGKCETPEGHVEVLIVLNAPENASPDILAQQSATKEQVLEWSATHPEAPFALHLLEPPPLPKKRAGVGLARKIGLDEALHRAYLVDNPDTILVSLDADCTCEPNYLCAIEQCFREHTTIAACCIDYHHPLQPDTASPKQIEAIAQYELYLRYYVQGIRYTEHPDAFHTVGSTIATKASTYQKVGGMNKRKAGEDFYFLQKLAQTGEVHSLFTTRVYPSSRPSDRNPFGTGPAVVELLTQDTPTYFAYDPISFSQVKQLFEDLPQLHDATQEQLPGIRAKWSDTLNQFLDSQSFVERWQEIQQNTASFDSFRRRWFQWFNAFQMVRWVHYSREHQAPDIPVTEAAIQLLALTGHTTHEQTDALSLLSTYRTWDQETL